MPEALTGVAETMRSVRLWRWETQKPVSVLREWMQVKDQREEESSGGKRMGEMGQLRKERDLRAVKERAASFGEQLVKERERRWRKGLEESQRVALFLFWQESLAVGMLRDWRALSCFGSSVESEEEEEDGDGVIGVGVGEEVGEGVGEREIVLLLLLVVVVERRRRRRVKRNSDATVAAILLVLC
jgi:hypothetical protein